MQVQHASVTARESTQLQVCACNIKVPGVTAFFECNFGRGEGRPLRGQVGIRLVTSHQLCKECPRERRSCLLEVAAIEVVGPIPWVDVPLIEGSIPRDLRKVCGVKLLLSGEFWFFKINSVDGG
jgi:hypothetical protein